MTKPWYVRDTCKVTLHSESPSMQNLPKPDKFAERYRAWAKLLQRTDGTQKAARYLRRNGVTLEAARSILL